MKVLIVDYFEDRYLDKIRRLGYEVSTYKTDDTFLKIVDDDFDKDAEILIGGAQLREMDFSKLPRLEYIFLISTGIDYLDHQKIIDGKYILTNNKGAYAEPIGEWVMYNLLQIEKKDKKNLKMQRDKHFIRRAYSGTIYNKTALILGTGAIAKNIAQKLKCFGSEVIGYNTNGREVEGFDRVVMREELESILPDVNYVISTLPDTEATYHFIDEDFISKLDPKAVIVNISRGSIIDEAALCKALEEKRIRAAALDVFEVEPLPLDSPLWDLENAYIYPHISFASEDDRERQLITAMENLRRLKKGGEFLNIVDFIKGY